MLVGIGRDTRLAGAIAASTAKVAQQAERLSDRWKTRRRSSGRPQREVDATAVEAPAEQPSLRVIRGAFYDQPRLVPVAHDGFDDPGPSAA